MAVSDGRGMGDCRLSPVCAPDFYGVKPGYACLACPLPSCHGCVKVMPTREEAVMLQCGAEIRVKEKARTGGNQREQKKILYENYNTGRRCEQ